MSTSHGAMTDDERADMHAMSTAHIRRNYHTCEQQLAMIGEKSHPRDYDDSAHVLLAWKAAYLDELVARNARVSR